MKILKINTKDFINWMYNSGADQEQEDAALRLGQEIIEGLLDGAVTITPQEILDKCEQSIIPLSLVIGYSDFNTDEIGLVYGSDFKIILV